MKTWRKGKAVVAKARVRTNIFNCVEVQKTDPQRYHSLRYLHRSKSTRRIFPGFRFPFRLLAILGSCAKMSKTLVRMIHYWTVTSITLRTCIQIHLYGSKSAHCENTATNVLSASHYLQSLIVWRQMQIASSRGSLQFREESKPFQLPPPVKESTVRAKADSDCIPCHLLVWKGCHGALPIPS